MECIRDKKYNSDIAIELDMSTSHVELIQYILCSADICEYGTSPRGCWFNTYPPEKAIDADEYIAKWKEYYQQKWNQPFIKGKI